MQMRPNLNFAGNAPGVPCWVETLQPHPRGAVAFYRALFGWNAVGPGPMADGGEYFVARLDNDDVAGIATLPAGGVAEPAWTTYVRVAECETAIQRVITAGGAVIVGVMDALPAGRLAIVEDPTGATLGLWEPHDRIGAQRINEDAAWAMSTLHTRSLDVAAPFYTAVFDWQIEPFDADGERRRLFRLPGYVGGLPEQPVPRDVVAVAIERPDIEQAFWSVDFWIDDLDAAIDCIAQRAGAIVKGPFDAGMFRHAVVADAAGAVFTLSQLMKDRSHGVRTGQAASLRAK